MKVSLITVVYNGAATIENAIQSVVAQDYPDIEYIIIDGASKDDTLEVVKRYAKDIAVLISEPDKGIYDAMNKGVSKATGDVIGILNADDMLAGPEVISAVVKQLQESGADTLIGDLVFVKEHDLNKVVRFYSSKDFKLKRFEKGDMPPHPTFYVRREVYEKYGKFNLDYRIISDFDIMLRFLYRNKVSFTYLPKVMVKMRMGGVTNSGISSKIKRNKEIHRSLNDNGIPTSLVKIYWKYFTKVLQLVKRPQREA